MACQDGEAIGHAQLAYDWQDGNARLGRVAIAPAKRGQGLAGPMVRLMMDEAFGTPGVERLELNVYMFNAVAIRTYERLGFKLEGVRRSSTRAGDEVAVRQGLVPKLPLFRMTRHQGLRSRSLASRSSRPR